MRLVESEREPQLRTDRIRGEKMDDPSAGFSGTARCFLVDLIIGIARGLVDAGGMMQNPLGNSGADFNWCVYEDSYVSMRGGKHQSQSIFREVCRGDRAVYQRRQLEEGDDVPAQIGKALDRWGSEGYRSNLPHRYDFGNLTERDPEGFVSHLEADTGFVHREHRVLIF